MSENGRKTIVLPADYTLDDVAGAHYYLEHHNLQLRDVDVIFFSHDTAIDNPDYYYIDCGPNDYKVRNCASALEVVSKDFWMATQSRAETKLLDVLDRNNKTGFLRKLKFSLAWAIRYARVIDRDPKKVLGKALDIIGVYLLTNPVEIMTNQLGAGSEMLSKIREELREIAGTEELDFHAFTLPWYMAAMEEMESFKTEIRDTMAYWVRYFKALEKAKEEAKAGEGIQSEFDIPGCGKAKLIVSDNPFIADAQVSGNAAMAVVWTAEGNVTILVNHRTGLSLAKLAAVLQEKEPGAWYYNQRRKSLHNGSPRRPQSPTTIKPAVLVALIKQKVQ